MDWSLFHLVNGPLHGHDAAQDVVELVNAWALPALVAAAALTWFLARPGGPPRSKLAAVCAAMAAGLGLLLDAALAQVWHHPRPFVDRPRATVLLVHHAADNSFPSDHATVAFAVALAVLAFHRRLGSAFLALAALVALDRVLVGVHYPSDVAASLAVGALSALLVVGPGRPWASRVVLLGSRLSDPLLLAATRRIARARRSPRR
jgi:undecaprenyl-diphosphatase